MSAYLAMILNMLTSYTPDQLNRSYQVVIPDVDPQKFFFLFNSENYTLKTVILVPSQYQVRENFI